MKKTKMFIITVSGLFSRQEYYFRELFRFSIFLFYPIYLTIIQFIYYLSILSI